MRSFVPALVVFLLGCSDTSGEARPVEPGPNESSGPSELDVGLLQRGIDYCLAADDAVLDGFESFSPDERQIPDLVRRFQSTPPRFENLAVELARIDGEEGELWVVRPRNGAGCEAMLTNADDHLDVLDRFLTSNGSDANTDESRFANFFWTVSEEVNRSNREAFVRVEGTGRDNTKRDEIQLTMTVTPIFSED